MERKYSWANIEDYLKQRLNTTDYIMTFGTIGSLNLEHDIDVIITKKPSAKASAFYREVHAVLFDLDTYLQRTYQSKLVRFSTFSHQEDVLTIAKRNPTDLKFHVMTYVSLPQIEIHWMPNMREGLTAAEIIKEYYAPLLGEIADIFSKDFASRGKNDHLVLYMNDLDRINSHYPKKQLLTVMNHLYAYVLKMAGSQESYVATNEQQCKENFYSVLDILEN